MYLRVVRLIPKRWRGKKGRVEKKGDIFFIWWSTRVLEVFNRGSYRFRNWNRGGELKKAVLTFRKDQIEQFNEQAGSGPWFDNLQEHLWKAWGLDKGEVVRRGERHVLRVRDLHRQLADAWFESNSLYWNIEWQLLFWIRQNWDGQNTRLLIYFKSKPIRFISPGSSKAWSKLIRLVWLLQLSTSNRRQFLQFHGNESNAWTVFRKADSWHCLQWGGRTHRND